MAETCGVHVNDYGTNIDVTVQEAEVALDISAATSIVYVFKKPVVEGSPAETFERAASFITDGTDGQVRYILAPGDIVVAGKWKLQVVVTTPTGVWHSCSTSFTVSSNLS